MKQREIPYNYTSWMDDRVIRHLLGSQVADLINTYHNQRAVRMLFEILGDIWVVRRNPYLQEDLLSYKARFDALVHALRHRLNGMSQHIHGHSDLIMIHQATASLIQNFEDELRAVPKKRKDLRKALQKFIHPDSLAFDPVSRVSHASDASDWRVAYPLAVVYPDSEDQVADIVQACIKLKISLVPRGGGTGYTGGAIPLDPHCVVINTEKLDDLSSISIKDGCSYATIRCGAGVVTRRVSDAAYQAGWVFAVDPTSQDSSCIGGNIATNAGGKKAVLWGTTLDNLLSWRMVDAQGAWVDIERLDHDGRKIHDVDLARFRITRSSNPHDELLEIPGHEFRHIGLGKDVSNKYLMGLPGVQKEGCDGIVTSATFILHRMPPVIRTVCLEFFGNATEATPAIVDIKRYMDEHESVQLAGLEHLDARYVKAVGYQAKAASKGRPKMVLIADIVGEDDVQVGEASSWIVRLANQRGGEGFVAVSPEVREQFWKDRSRTAAIAKHTNAFKINEDVVIPLHNLGAYTDGIEWLNIEASLDNKCELLSRLLEEMGHSLHADMQQRVKEVLAQWKEWRQALSQKNWDVFCSLRDGVLRASWRTQIRQPILDVQPELQKVLDHLHRKVLRTRTWIALHMHAGDGNVHTNIPVNSDSPEMLSRAHQMVAQVMHLAQSLDGVISGEHGIGLTKYQFLDAKRRSDFAQYKAKVDPEGWFNRGKLLEGADLSLAYTPSFALLGVESIILQQSELDNISKSIKDCLRCGKCKPVCTTHVPRANLLYSPRNKILATGLLIEAYLYESQTRRGHAKNHWQDWANIADHCTVCHRCYNPCPVDIDFGDVSIAIRGWLNEQKNAPTNYRTRLAMAFLNAKDPKTIAWLRLSMINFGFRMQRWASSLWRLWQQKNASLSKVIRSTEKSAPPIQQIVHFIRKPLPKNIPRQTARAMLDIQDDRVIPIIRSADKAGSEAVFYFPGCGSERLFSQVGLATQAMLWHIGVQTVLPPGYLCCGYPQTASGQKQKGDWITAENRVLFHRMANTLNYLDIKTVLVSCGTCLDQLARYNFEQIFPGCRVIDIHEFLMEKGISSSGISGVQYVYHDPCHSPMKQHQPSVVVNRLIGTDVPLSDRCCGESGTFSVARPDIASQVRSKKEEVLMRDRSNIPNPQQGIKVLTSCPSCLQGLARYESITGEEADYIVVELAKNILGHDWLNDFIHQARQGGIERVLL